MLDSPGTEVTSSCLLSLIWVLGIKLDSSAKRLSSGRREPLGHLPSLRPEIQRYRQLCEAPGRAVHIRSLSCQTWRAGGLETLVCESWLAEAGEVGGLSHPLTAVPQRLPRQFDFTFVEVYRVKKFHFTSKHVEDEDNDLKELEKQKFGHIRKDKPPCACSAPRSSWNCDGEILHSPSIEVR